MRPGLELPDLSLFCQENLRRPLYLVVGMLNTKDAVGFLIPLAPHVKALAGVTIPGEQNPHHAEAIATAARCISNGVERVLILR